MSELYEGLTDVTMMVVSRKKLLMIGGDDLEENFIIDDDRHSSGSESESDNDLSPNPSVDESADDGDISPPLDRSDAEPVTKKVKLNWREISSRCSGSREDQLQTLRISRLAYEKFYPHSTAPLDVESLSTNRFVDLSSFAAQESKNAQALFECLRSAGFLKAHVDENIKGLRTLIVTSSATRGMYLVKELKEFDKTLSPLPLFFHGGGRKKEQAETHDAVIKGRKSMVAVCLPSRLKAVAESAVIDFKQVDLVLFDLKSNEKQLNVLSMKDTMGDCLTIIGRFILGGNHHTVLGLI